ncbi:MAG: Hpt domain-containing protein [Roseovarius sp.]|nr:Hpt domain-containing protein [Roseovarius sp.]
MTSAIVSMPGIERIQNRFLQKLDQREVRLSNAIHVSCENDSERERKEALRECQQILHKLAGSSGTVGFKDLGEGARYCEELIEAYLAGQTSGKDQMYEMLTCFLKGVEAMPERKGHRTAV